MLARFNPRPLLLTGESEGDGDRRQGQNVSIHARYC